MEEGGTSIFYQKNRVEKLLLLQKHRQKNPIVHAMPIFSRFLFIAFLGVSRQSARGFQKCHCRGKDI
jgi:hypothetical protein